MLYSTSIVGHSKPSPPLTGIEVIGIIGVAIVTLGHWFSDFVYYIFVSFMIHRHEKYINHTREIATLLGVFMVYSRLLPNSMSTITSPLKWGSYRQCLSSIGTLQCHTRISEYITCSIDSESFGTLTVKIKKKR